MPIFEFRCSECNEVSERLCKFEDQVMSCKLCGEEANRIVSAPKGLVIEGYCYENEYGKGSIKKQEREMIEATEKKLGKSLGGGDSGNPF